MADEFNNSLSLSLSLSLCLHVGTDCFKLYRLNWYMLGNESSNIKGIGDQNIFIGHYIVKSLYLSNNFHPPRYWKLAIAKARCFLYLYGRDLITRPKSKWMALNRLFKRNPGIFLWYIQAKIYRRVKNNNYTMLRYSR